MQQKHLCSVIKFLRFAALTAGLCTASFLSSPLSAQQQGPLPPPPAGSQSAAQPQPPPAPARSPDTKNDPATISHEAPPIPVEEIIKKFGEREAEFRRERGNYTYTQTFLIQTIDDDALQPRSRECLHRLSNPISSFPRLPR